jgi:hypothetical protein
MPVVQLQNDTGANLGSALGAAAGYFATQKQRKADKQAATTRQADLDKQNTQKNQDYHDEVTSKIQETAGQEARTKEQDVNAQFQQAANAKANNLLSSPPAGQDPAQWAQSVWTKATTPPSSGGLGLTDSKMLGDLYTQVQTAVQKATQAKQQKFIQGEQTLSGDPNKAIGTLMKRQQIEGGQGIDPKRTQDAITATQKQITEAQAAAYKNADFGERKRHDAAIENRPHGAGRTPSAQEQYFVQHGYMPPSYAEAHPKTKNDSHSAELGGLGSPAFRGLPATTQVQVRGLVSKHGIGVVTDQLTKIANGTPSKLFTKQQAAQALKGLTATGAQYKDDSSMDDDDDQ